MKKIDYSNFTNINDIYINKIYSQNLQTQWEKLQRSLIARRTGLSIYPSDVKQILIADFSALTNIYNDSENLTEAEKNAAQRIFNYDTAKSKLKSIPANNSLSRITKSDKYNEKIANFFIENSNSIGITSCYYCEMAYIFPYKADVYEKNKLVGKDKRMFDLDHFFEKADSPITALSLYNFIPSCQVCNSRIKGKKDLDTLYRLKNETIKVHITDFSEISPSSPNYDFDNQVTIKVEPIKKEIKDGENNSNIGFISDMDKNEVKFETNNICCSRDISAFRLEERYNFPLIKKKALLLEELKQLWSDSRIEDIVDYFNSKNENISKEMIIKSIFLDADNTKSIFAKMRRAILLK